MRAATTSGGTRGNWVMIPIVTGVLLMLMWISVSNKLSFQDDQINRLGSRIQELERELELKSGQKGEKIYTLTCSNIGTSFELLCSMNNYKIRFDQQQEIINSYN